MKLVISGFVAALLGVAAGVDRITCSDLSKNSDIKDKMLELTLGVLVDLENDKKAECMTYVEKLALAPDDQECPEEKDANACYKEYYNKLADVLPKNCHRHSVVKACEVAHKNNGKQLTELQSSLGSGKDGLAKCGKKSGTNGHNPISIALIDALCKSVPEVEQFADADTLASKSVSVDFDTKKLTCEDLKGDLDDVKDTLESLLPSVMIRIVEQGSCGKYIRKLEASITKEDKDLCPDKSLTTQCYQEAKAAVHQLLPSGCTGSELAEACAGQSRAEFDLSAATDGEEHQCKDAMYEQGQSPLIGIYDGMCGSAVGKTHVHSSKVSGASTTTAVTLATLATLTATLIATLAM